MATRVEYAWVFECSGGVDVAMSLPVMTNIDDGLSVFMSVRPRLYGIAYRMLRSVADAEDIVQDVWVRWQTTDRSVVRDSAAFLATTTTRLAINVMQSARSRRETCVGAWLHEPVDTSTNPGLHAEQSQALQSGLLILLKNLSPIERAAYILREAFDYPYRDIANRLQVGEANARQVVTRARQHVANCRGLSCRHNESTYPVSKWGRGINHETRHYRRHWADRIKARGQTA